ncbi:MAG: hypothetical protein KDD33_11780 [Bdellovibrionales bacterium]|nr:hypothetical protein [Bdellovibrionales bacterium]
MAKIMLVIENPAEEKFLHTLIKGLSYQVVTKGDGGQLAQDFIDHFPDVVFASTLGTKSEILNTLAKIKKMKGKPKVILVKQERDTTPITQAQGAVVDAVLYSPIDPFKLLTVLSSTTSTPLEALKKRYKEMMAQFQRNKEGSEDLIDEDETLDFGKVTPPKAADHSEDFGVIQSEERDPGPTVVRSKKEPHQHGSVLIIDAGRKKKYDEICAQLPGKPDGFEKFDGAKLRQLQSEQAKKMADDPEAANLKKLKSHFLKTLFSMSPKKASGDE